MIRDFQVVDAVEVHVGGVVFDLHNFFDLTSLATNVSEKSLQLEFSPTSQLEHPSPRRLTLVFLGVDYLAIGPGEGEVYLMQLKKWASSKRMISIMTG